MKHVLLKLFRLLTSKQRRRFVWLQGLLIFSALLEVVNVMLIGSFMGMVANPGQFGGATFLEMVLGVSGAENQNDALIFLGTAALGVLFVSSLISVYVAASTAMFAAKIGADLGNRLFQYYITQSWLFHVGKNSGDLINRITQECGRIATGIVQPFMVLNAKFVLAVAILIGLIIYDPYVAIFCGLFFGGAYFAIYIFVKRRLTWVGERVSVTLEHRMRVLNEGLLSAKDVKILGLEDAFSVRFNGENDELHYQLGLSNVYRNAPRYVIELLTFASVVLIVLLMLNRGGQQMAAFLPTLAIFGLAGLKLLPAFQAVYTSSTYIAGNASALLVLENDLRRSIGVGAFPKTKTSDVSIFASPDIRIENLGFSYPRVSAKALRSINIDIPHNSIIGFAGKSGSGKSTLVDLLLGLLEPCEGEILVNEVALNNENLGEWRKHLAYVPQMIHLSDATILENVAFGVPMEQIDIPRARRALELASLWEFITDLDQGIQTSVGERGLKLSGGQRQRIGIARAFYRDFSVLVLDEATSALDNLTEQAIVDAIDTLAGKKTLILVAHRLTTLKQCGLIYLLDNGQIVDCGDYEELAGRHPDFFADKSRDYTSFIQHSIP